MILVALKCHYKKIQHTKFYHSAVDWLTPGRRAVLNVHLITRNTTEGTSSA